MGILHMYDVLNILLSLLTDFTLEMNSLQGTEV